MKRAYINDLVEEVRITIDQNRKDGSYLESDTDNMELNEIIRTKLVDSARFILESAPIDMVEPAKMEIPQAAQYMQTDGSGYIVLPPDFLRLIYFKMLSWNKGVTNVAEEGSNIALMQHCLFTRGTPLKPICVLSHDMSGNRILEYYTVGFNTESKCKQRDHRIDRALYIQKPQIVSESGKDILMIPSLLRFSIVNYCAGLTEISRSNINEGKAFLEIANGSLNK